MFQDNNILRPRTLDEYVGQTKLKENLKVYIDAAKSRNEPLDHVLFYGPPGLGKTTLAGIIANELGHELKITSGPTIEKPGDLVALLTTLKEGDILFIDEIHRINKQIEEVLYPAMEDYAVDIMVGEGTASRSIRLDLPKFTLVGATTRAGSISAPMRDRFGIVMRLNLYNANELTSIVKRSASILGIGIDKKGAYEIASRSRGTPRIANRLLKRSRDFAQVKYNNKITKEVADNALSHMNIDKFGLDSVDQNLLWAIKNNFGGGPVGLETLAATIGEDSSTIEDVCEPYLMKIGFIQKTPRGRCITQTALDSEF